MFAFHRQHRSFAWCQRKLIRKLIIMGTDCAWYVRFLLFELTLFLRFFWAFRGKCWCSLYTVRWYNAWPSGACIWKIWAGEFLLFSGVGKTHKDAASVRATHAIPAACGIYYFEVRIVSKGRDGWVVRSFPYFLPINSKEQNVRMNIAFELCFIG